jgi:hypothetical protein
MAQVSVVRERRFPSPFTIAGQMNSPLFSSPALAAMEKPRALEAEGAAVLSYRPWETLPMLLLVVEAALR